MKLYDLSKELFEAEVYPGDPKAVSGRFLSIEKGEVCNLSVLTMGSHNGTHMDAPYHFWENGRAIDEVPLEQVMGMCDVVEVQGDVVEVQGDVGRSILEKAVPQNCERLLLKGRFQLKVEGAEYLAERKILVYGVENMTVGEGEDGVEIHRILLGEGMVILESLVLEKVPAGRYFLCAAPLKMKGMDGSPCRPVLIEF